jgi:uncharacterized cupredoxin-like copper-binding protein/mono/diheme cytochrome c family protein
MLAVTQTTGIVMAGVGLAIVVLAIALIVARVRRPDAAEKGPEIPPAMRPGPSDPNLEKPILEKLQGWGVLLTIFLALWMALYWLGQPKSNAAQEEHLKTQAIEHGANEVQLFDDHSNAAGVGCVRCHGPELRGQELLIGGVIQHSADLTTVCSRLTGDEVVQTIKEGRGAMPSWSIEFQGALNDQQIGDVYQYLLTIQKVPYADNKCINPKAASPAPPAPSPSASGSPAEASASPSASSGQEAGPMEVKATIQDMSISLSSSTAPAGKVSFVVTNKGPSTHEFVVLSTKTPADKFPIASFEGEANRFNEDAAGIINVGEAGEIQPGKTKTLTIDMAPGHYAIICNLPGHYAAGMHQDFQISAAGNWRGSFVAIRSCPIFPSSC